MAELNETPSGMRTHIGVFGKTNCGKSSLINALTNQSVSIVSAEPGTTTDPVKKAIEILPIGPCLLIDTAGIEDETILATLRMERTYREANHVDVAIIILSGDDISPELELASQFVKNDIPVIYSASHSDEEGHNARINSYKNSLPKDEILSFSSATGQGIDELKNAIINKVSITDIRTIFNEKIKRDDIVMLIMPQDKQAPKGRLILPQVSVLRELLDSHAKCICIAPEEMDSALDMLNKKPKLIITDSQVFETVYSRKPKESELTSFSVLYAALKGDVPTYIEGAKAINELKPGAKILIAESCSHAPKEEDIGRVKIPALLKQRIGGEITVDVAAGADFPEDLSGYDLIIQCGGCMVNRRQIMSRIHRAKNVGVPITNYGICIAYMKGIINNISIIGG